MTRYHLELLYSDEARPTACAMLETGAIHVHLTNEQTILYEFRADNVKADVPPRLKGMASFSKSVNTRRKWIVTRSVLRELVSHLIESQD